MKTIVVVGNGMVGFRLCELLASAGATRRFRVRVFGSEPVPAYDRVRLARLLGDGRAEDLQLAPRGWYEARGIDLVTGDPVIAIDRDRCTVTTLAGRNVRYDRLVLATGSRPVVPPIRGSDSRGVTALRTLDDARFVRERVAHMGAQVAILGGGLLGVEAACALRDVGVVPCVVEAGERLLPRHLDDVCAGALERRLEARGISVRTGVSARRIAKKRGNLVVSLDTGSSILADAVVIAAGIRARDGLAKGADLAVDDGGGVRVDDRMRCSDPRVLAVGECASHQGVRYGVVGPGYEMARVAADTLLGRRSRFRPPRPGYRLKVPGIEVAVVGAGCAGEATHSYRMRKGGRSVAVERGRVVGACTVGGWDELPALEESIARGARVRPRQLDRFGEHGLLGLARRRASRLPDAAVVCRCAGVTRGALARAAPTCAGPAEVAAQTGAGQSCGSCLPLVAEICGGPAPSRRPARLLLAMSAVAVAACAAFAALPPLATWPRAAELAGSLWRSGAPRKVTGFVLLGLCALGLVLPIAKRLRGSRGLRLARHRSVHAALGLLAASAAAVHTGMQLGHHMNQALMVGFLALVGTGGALGALTAAPARALVTRVRPVVMVTHVLVLWVLPVLLGFHIFAAYYF